MKHHQTLFYYFIMVFLLFGFYSVYNTQAAKSIVEQEQKYNGTPTRTPKYTRRPLATETITLTTRPTATIFIPTVTASNTALITWTSFPTKTLTPTLTRKPIITQKIVITPTLTRKPIVTQKIVVTPTLTRNPLATDLPTSTATATIYVVTPTISPTPTLTSTPDIRGLTIPNPDNFELIISHLATAINYVSVMQEGKADIDKSDLVEDFLNFNKEKYQEYLRGERPYKYLKFQEFRRGNIETGDIVVRAIIIVPDSSDGRYDREYLDLILKYLKDTLKVDVSKIDEQKRVIIARDIGESNRLTCVKFLRLIWGMFGDYHKNGNGLFPEIYQARIVFAGQLAYQSEGSGNIFSESNQKILKNSRIKNAMIIAENPENRPDIFNEKIAVFFRAQANEFESGHVGISKLIPEYDEKGKLLRFLITFIEVDGNTGQAYYAYRLYIEDFRNHLYIETVGEYRSTQRNIGWLFNREN